MLTRILIALGKAALLCFTFGVWFLLGVCFLVVFINPAALYCCLLVAAVIVAIAVFRRGLTWALGLLYILLLVPVAPSFVVVVGCTYLLERLFHLLAALLLGVTPGSLGFVGQVLSRGLLVILSLYTAVILLQRQTATLPTGSVLQDVLPVYVQLAAGIAFLLVALKDARKLLALPVTRWGAPPLKPLPHSPPTEGGTVTEAPAVLKVAHLSDLHLGGTDTEVRVEDGLPCGNVPTREVLSLFANQLKQSDAIVLTGDLTDSGTDLQWRECSRLLDSVVREKVPICIVPGNHDLNIPALPHWFATGKSGWQAWVLATLGLPARYILSVFEELQMYDRQQRMARFLLYSSRLMTGTAFVFQEPCKLESLESHLGSFRSSLETCASTSFSDLVSKVYFEFRERSSPPTGLPSYPAVEKVWKSCFPIVVPLREKKVAFLILDSNRASHVILTNSFGEIGEEQGKRLQRIIYFLAGQDIRSFVILVHHHIAIPPMKGRSILSLGTWRSRLKMRASSVLDAWRVLQGLPDGLSVLILNGHHHMQYAAQLDDTVCLVSAASTAYGSEEMPDTEFVPPWRQSAPGFVILGIRPTSDGAKLEPASVCER